VEDNILQVICLR